MFDFGFGWFILGFGVLSGGGYNIDVWVFWVWILGDLRVFVVLVWVGWFCLAVVWLSGWVLLIGL